MEHYPFAVTLSKALVTDGELSSWCRITYGRPLSVYIQPDERDSFSADVCPAITVAALDQAGGQGAQVLSKGYKITLLISDRNEAVMVEDNLFVFEGGARLEVFKNYTIDVMRETKPANVDLQFVCEVESVDQFPIMKRNIFATYTQQVLVGSDIWG